MGIDNNKANRYDTIESEVADVFIVLCSGCNKLDIDSYKALKDKEQENIMRIIISSKVERMSLKNRSK